MAKGKDIKVVTYVQQNGRKATTTVTPAQEAALREQGRLVKVHDVGR